MYLFYKYNGHIVFHSFFQEYYKPGFTERWKTNVMFLWYSVIDAVKGNWSRVDVCTKPIAVKLMKIGTAHSFTIG